MPVTVPVRDLTLIAPEVYLTLLGVVVLICDLYVTPRTRNLPAVVAAIGLVGGFAPLIWLWGAPPQTELMGALVVDGLALYLKGIVLLAGLMVILLSTDFLRSVGSGYGEYFSLMVFAVLGMSVLAGANDIIVLYVAFELVSFVSYVLAAYLRRDPKSNEAGLKYFLYGVAASAMMLYGLSLLYGLGGETNIIGLREGLRGGALGGTPIAALALVLVGVGLGYKVAMAPFHAWAPDVYEGAPTPVTAFLSVAPKAAGLVILTRVFWSIGGPLLWGWPMVLALLATLTMFTGNLLAIRQTDLKRMLAYSSIAHAGYMLIPIVVGPRVGWALQSLLFYLGAYLVMNLGAFAVVTLVQRSSGDAHVSRYEGLARSEPIVAVSMFVFLLSLTGIPGTAGFVGKFMLFGAAVDSGSWAWLAVVGIVNSTISLYYYMNVARLMYFAKGSGLVLTARPAGTMVVIGATLIATVVAGLLPMWLLSISERAAQLAMPF